MLTYKNRGLSGTNFTRAGKVCMCFLRSWKVFSCFVFLSNFLFAHTILRSGRNQSFARNKNQFSPANHLFRHWTSLWHISDFISSMAFKFIQLASISCFLTIYPIFYWFYPTWTLRGDKRMLCRRMLSKASQRLLVWISHLQIWPTFHSHRHQPSMFLKNLLTILR